MLFAGIAVAEYRTAPHMQPPWISCVIFRSPIARDLKVLEEVLRRPLAKAVAPTAFLFLTPSRTPSPRRRPPIWAPALFFFSLNPFTDAVAPTASSDMGASPKKEPRQ
jgi:hypothetical protein